MRPVVAIDGPAGAGKTTIARAVAEALGWRYLDTGAMYRAVATAVLEAGKDPASPGDATEVAAGATIALAGERVLLDGRDVTERIRHDDVTAAAPLVATHPGVRERLVELQRGFASAGRVVLEGRDIGAVVVPDAAVKIFLTASGPVRAARRGSQLGLPDDEHTMTAIESSLQERDRIDSSRSTSPLTQTDDAVVVDSSDKTVEEIVREIVALVAARCGP